MTVWRAGFWPAPAVSTWPMMTSDTASPGHAGLGEQALDHVGAEFGRGHLGERAAELADRRARAATMTMSCHASLLDG